MKTSLRVYRNEPFTFEFVEDFTSMQVQNISSWAVHKRHPALPVKTLQLQQAMGLQLTRHTGALLPLSGHQLTMLLPHLKR